MNNGVVFFMELRTIVVILFIQQKTVAQSLQGMRIPLSWVKGM